MGLLSAWMEQMVYGDESWYIVSCKQEKKDLDLDLKFCIEVFAGCSLSRHSDQLIRSQLLKHLSYTMASDEILIFFLFPLLP